MLNIENILRLVRVTRRVSCVVNKQGITFLPI